MLNKKNCIFLLPLAMLILATFSYAVLINSFNDYGAENNRYLEVQDAYKTLPPESVIFLGDSQVREDLDCSLIGAEEDTEAANCFNFGVAGIIPVQLALQKEQMVSSRPKVVFLGVSPLLFNENMNKNDDFYFLKWEGQQEQQQEQPDSFLFPRLTAEEKDLLQMDKIDRLLYKRKFVLPHYLGIIKQVFSAGKSSGSRQKAAFNSFNNFNNPYLFTEEQSKEELAAKVNDPEITGIFDFSSSSKRQRESFIYLIHELKKENITVVIIQMPLNPILLEKINPQSLSVYDQYLSEISSVCEIPLIDFGANFAEDEFIDLTHLNQKGRARFSKMIGHEINNFNISSNIKKDDINREGAD